MDIVLRYAMELTRGLSYLHSRNIIHGELEPRYILLNENKVKIGGFPRIRVDSAKAALLNPGLPLLQTDDDDDELLKKPERRLTIAQAGNSPGAKKKNIVKERPRSSVYFTTDSVDSKDGFAAGTQSFARATIPAAKKSEFAKMKVKEKKPGKIAFASFVPKL